MRKVAGVNKPTKRVSLVTETVRKLTGPQLSAAVGGGPEPRLLDGEVWTVTHKWSCAVCP